MHIGFGWRVQGNEEAAENLAGFLINCDSNSINPLKPIQFSGNDDIITLTCPKTYFPFEPSISWDFEDNFYCHSLNSKERDRVKKDKRMLVVSVLKKLDKEGIVLPFFDRLNEVPGIISSRVSYINNNQKYQKLKLSEILERKEDPASSNLFSENLTEFNIPDCTTKTVFLSKKFAQQGPEVIYNGEYFFDRGSVYLQDISISIVKKIRLKKENVDKCPLKIKDIETSIKNEILEPRKINFVDSRGCGFQAIRAGYYTTILKGDIYTPEKTEDLTTLETLAYWLIENNVPQEETKPEEKAKTTPQTKGDTNSTEDVAR